MHLQIKKKLHVNHNSGSRVISVQTDRETLSFIICKEEKGREEIEM